LPLARLATASGLIAALLAAVLLLEPLPFAALIGLILLQAGFEWSRLLGVRGARALLYAGCLVALYGAAVWRLHPLAAFPQALSALLLAATAFWLVVVPWWLALGLESMRRATLQAAGFLALVPAGLAAAAMAPAKLLMLLAFIWVADSAAYLAGSAFGRTRLAPAISPGKTWEGVVGALAGCLLYAIICAMLDPGLHARVAGLLWVPYLVMAAGLCATSVVGDLFESSIKRRAGVKDSGTLLPGHGGALDRIDSAMAALPAGALLLDWAGAA
jgi:phosphatidate cytidylyltransferase